MPDFYARYPDLAINTNLEQGINVEGFHVENMSGFAVIDGNIFPEYYEKMRINKDADEIQILLHGKEMYLRADSKGKLNETGGEFMMVLFLRMEGSGWQIYKTDEVTLREWKEERSGMN